MVPLDIQQGTLPAVDPQLNNPRLRGGFVNLKKQIQLHPNIDKLFDFSNARASFESTFQKRTIVVTQGEVFYIENNSINVVGPIIATASAVRLAENTANEITIVNGAGAWVFSQETNSFVKLNSANNGFDIENPVDVTVLNTITVVVGGTDKRWIVSEANNALEFGGNEVVVTDNSVGNLTGCEDLNNNLFIFGTGGIQRWVPSIERLPTDFPFTQDPTYRDDYGCVSTGSLITDNNQLFYLSQEGKVRMMTDQGRGDITNDGIENIIRNFTDPTNSFGSYYYHKGYYFYSLSFPDNKNTFVYCPKAKRWSESDQLWLGFSGNALLVDGVYEINSDFTVNGKTLVIQTPYFMPKLTNLYARSVLGSVLLEITQGKNESDDTQVCFLQISKDNIVYGNSVSRRLSATAKRLFQFRWYLNVANNGFSLRFTLQLKQDIACRSAFISLS